MAVKYSLGVRTTREVRLKEWQFLNNGYTLEKSVPESVLICRWNLLVTCEAHFSLSIKVVNINRLSIRAQRVDLTLAAHSL